MSSALQRPPEAHRARAKRRHKYLFTDQIDQLIREISRRDPIPHDKGRIMRTSMIVCALEARARFDQRFGASKPDGSSFVIKKGGIPGMGLSAGLLFVPLLAVYSLAAAIDIEEGS